VPQLNNYVCHACKKSIHYGWGTYLYVVTPDGHRITCPHPGELFKIAEVLDLTYEEVSSPGRKRWWWSRKRCDDYDLTQQLIRERTGKHTFCVCRECKEPSYLDLGIEQSRGPRDKWKCPRCGSQEIDTLSELIGKPCPLCGEGVIEEIVTGM
jgi:ribosomal protein S27AE